MGNRLGVRSSHTPEKSMAQRQSFPVHKKQQKLAPVRYNARGQLFSGAGTSAMQTYI